MDTPNTPTRYGTRKRMSPAGVAVVIALHAAAITAVVMSKSYIARIDNGPIIIDTVPVPPPPEPLPPQPETNLPDPPITRTVIPIPHRQTLPPIEPIRENVRPPVAPPPPPPPPPPLQPRDPVIVRAQFADASALQPGYPSRLLRQGLEGDVTVRVHIGANGRVTEVRRVSADHELFFEATRDQALRRWRFTPETRDGRAVESWQTHTVQFRIT